MTVKLLDHMGNDLFVVNNAKASLDRFSAMVAGWDCPGCEWHVLDSQASYGHSSACNAEPRRFEKLSEGDERLLRSLARNRHGTPFEGVVFRFHVETSIRVAREWFRHRIASYSEMSTRFMVMTKERENCYIPSGDAWRANAPESKVMDYAFVPITDSAVTDHAAAVMRGAYRAAFDAYEDLLAEGVAREVAAFVLPLGMRTAFITTVNLRSMLNFISLRNAPQALYEIRQEAEQVEALIASVCPVAHDAFVQGGRIPI